MKMNQRTSDAMFYAVGVDRKDTCFYDVAGPREAIYKYVGSLPGRWSVRILLVTKDKVSGHAYIASRNSDESYWVRASPYDPQEDPV